MTGNYMKIGVRNKTIIGLKYVWGRVNAPFTVG